MQGKLQDQLNEMIALQNEKSSELLLLKSQIDSLKNSDLESLYQEVKTIYPLLKEIAVAKSVLKTDFSNTTEVPIAMVNWGALKPIKDRRNDEDKMTEFIKLRTGLDTLVIINY